ncbi:hypothetical protein JCM11641_007114 [Rhodosporidiobolus odoratus]
MAPLTLRLQAKSSPAPIGLAALAFSLPPAQINLEWVHAFPNDAPNGINSSVQIDGKTTYGSNECFRAIGDLFAAEGLCGKDNKDTTEIASLLLTIPAFPATFPTATAFLSHLEQRLTLRTYLVSHAPTIADYAVFSALKTNTIAQPLLPKAPHTQRWFTAFSSRPEAQKAWNEIGVQAKVKPPKEDKKKGAKGEEENKANATFELGLPGAVKGQVVTRLPPEPSGYLHIGHAKAAILNQYFARMYEGKFLVRFDDTNPSKEKAEFEQSIVEDLALLGIKADATSYTSDYFDQLQQYAVEMIKRGKAYADDTEQEVMRDQRMNGLPSARRESTAEESLARFAEMATGSAEGRRWCLRAKMSVDDPNKALRDPVIYRTNDLPHHRTGTKWKIYPTYDFCCPIVDSMEGVTHALRTNEYRDRNPQYQWMLEALGLRRVEVWDFGRLAFVYTLLSKRKLKWFVEENVVEGWDDPRFPTVRGIRRRGMTIEAITQFMLLQGPSQAFLNLEWDVIWNLNKKVIDPVAPRFVALEKEGLVPVKVIGGQGKPAPGQVESKQNPKHKKNPEVGLKTTYYADTFYVEQADAVTFAQDEEVTFMDWGNSFVRSIERDESTGKVQGLEVELNLEGDFKKTKKKVTWIASPDSDKGAEALIPVELVDYDYLITKNKLEEEDSVEDLLNPKTEYRTAALADANLATVPHGTILQFERKGYYILDRAYDASSPTPAAVLILIPDGKASSVALKHQAASASASSTPATGAAGGEDKKKKKTSAKDKVAATAAAGGKKQGGAAKGGGKVDKFPELAPNEPIEVVTRSEGERGFEIPVKTKMYASRPLNGGEDYPVPVTTNMFEVKKVTEQHLSTSSSGSKK